MRTGRSLTAAAFTVAATGFAAVPALAAQGGLEVYPATAAPGATVTLTTTACGARGTASVDAGAVGPGPFTLAPVQDSARAGGRFAVPVSAQPGTYEIVARCSGGARVTGDLIVSFAQAGATGPRMPRGLVRSGLGGALGPDPVQIAAGVAALAAAAACGTWLLHRRARGGGL
ncbi:hypothetical protein ACIRF8_04960 [Streptomyces sp. NPDC102406]|uniref:hypothetical protein n=1 Tax=Streptomyces sp. NPDC102406 TaxID=3366171 RepID=UPI00381F82FB